MDVVMMKTCLESSRQRLVLGVLAGVGSLVVKELEEVVQTGRQNSAQKGADPVNPVVVGELAHDDVGAKGAGGVDASASVVDGKQVADKEGNANGKRGHEGAAVLLNGHEEHGGAEQGSGKHFNENTLRARGLAAKGVVKGNGAGGHGRDSSSSGNTSHNLGNHEQNGAHRGDGTNKGQGQGNGRVELATGDSEKDENVDHDGKAKAKGNHDELLGVRAVPLGGNERRLVGNLGNELSEKQKHEGAAKLADNGNEVVAQAVGEASNLGPRQVVGRRGLLGRLGGGQDGFLGVGHFNSRGVGDVERGRMEWDGEKKRDNLEEKREVYIDFEQR